MAYFEYNLAGLGLGAVLEPKKAMRLIEGHNGKWGSFEFAKITTQKARNRPDYKEGVEEGGDKGVAYSGQLRQGGEVFLNVLINIGTIARGRKDAHAICVRGTAVAHM